MCRWMAWHGQPLLIDELLFKSPHGIVDQSLHCPDGRRADERRRVRPRLVRRLRRPGRLPAASPRRGRDANLRELAEHVKSPLFLAHVRAAIGSPVQQTNCHPFRHGRWLFVHNGYLGGFHAVRRELMLAIDPQLFADVHGSTDTEVVFQLALTLRPEEDPMSALERTVGLIEAVAERHGVPDAVQATFGVSDGATLWAVRYATAGPARSLFASSDAETVRSPVPGQPALPAARPRRPPDRLRAVLRPARPLAGDPRRQRRDRCAPAARSSTRPSVPSRSPEACPQHHETPAGRPKRSRHEPDPDHLPPASAAAIACAARPTSASSSVRGSSSSRPSWMRPTSGGIAGAQRGGERVRAGRPRVERDGRAVQLQQRQRAAADARDRPDHRAAGRRRQTLGARGERVLARGRASRAPASPRGRGPGRGRARASPRARRATACRSARRARADGAGRRRSRRARRRAARLAGRRAACRPRSRRPRRPRGPTAAPAARPPAARCRRPARPEPTSSMTGHAECAQRLDLDRLDEPDRAEVRRVDAQDRPGLRPQHGRVVRRPRPVRGAHLDHPRAGLGDDLGDPEARRRSRSPARARRRARARPPARRRRAASRLRSC